MLDLVSNIKEKFMDFLFVKPVFKLSCRPILEWDISTTMYLQIYYQTL